MFIGARNVAMMLGGKSTEKRYVVQFKHISIFREAVSTPMDWSGSKIHAADNVADVFMQKVWTGISVFLC